MEFFEVLLKYNFLQNSLIAGILTSIACGITGTFVIVKRIGFISGGIAHTALGGIGVAYYYGIDPIIGAVVSALLAAVLIGIITIRTREQSDTIIGAMWAIGMAIGIIFMSMTPGYNVNILTYLFGNILMVSKYDLLRLFMFDLGIVVIVILFYRQFVSISFDEDYSRLRGLKVNTIYILLLCLIALTIVVMIHVVGLILLIALLTIPAAISRIFVKRISRMMIFSVLIGLLFTISGLAISYSPKLPAGATIIVVSGIVYMFILVVKRG